MSTPTKPATKPHTKLSEIFANARDPLPVAPQAWQDVEQTLLAHFRDPDIEAAKILFACAAAHRIADYPPAWLMFIAPPGTMKTVLLESLRLSGLNTHYVDEVTPNTFISGKIEDPFKPKQAPSSLLHRIGTEGIIINADFGTVLNMNRNTYGSVLAQLRRIYDGHLRREFGTDENLDEREWEGRLTVLAGVTPDVDKHHALFQALGERFLYVRSDRVGGVDAALCAMQQTEEVQWEVAVAVIQFVSPVIEPETICAPGVPQEYLERVAALGEFVVRARADVPRDRSSRKIEGQPIIESNTRCPQQLVQVARGWAVLSRRSEVNEDDFALVARVAFDSIPPVRAKVLKAMMNSIPPYNIDVPKSVVGRALEDLEAVGLVEQRKGEWMLSGLTFKFLGQAGLIREETRFGVPAMS